MEVKDEARAAYDLPELAELWARARRALENPRNGSPGSVTVTLPTADARDWVERTLERGRRRGRSTRIDLAELDAALRRGRFGLRLVEVLELVHGKPVVPRLSAARERARRRQHVEEVLRTALAAHDLANTPWAARWIDWVWRYGQVDVAELPMLATRAAAVLSEMHLSPDDEPTRWIGLSELAGRRGGGTHELDSGKPLSRLVLRAAAFAHRHTEAPSSRNAQRELWECCGVLSDSVTATALVWALPAGDDPWSRALAARTELGLPTHVTRRDLPCCPDPLVPPGTVVAVCENPRVLEAVVDAGIRHPMVCVSGQPSLVAVELLTRLAEAGAQLRYHGDFDPSGLEIARRVLTLPGAAPWRMSAQDYLAALEVASQEGVELPALQDRLPDTPWDERLAAVMAEASVAVAEEVVLATLLDDLRTGAPAPVQADAVTP